MNSVLVLDAARLFVSCSDVAEVIPGYLPWPIVSRVQVASRWFVDISLAVSQCDLAAGKSIVWVCQVAVCVCACARVCVHELCR